MELLKKHLIPKRHTLEANSFKSANTNDKETSPKSKTSSNIPRFKKNITEGFAPSFMSRHQKIHNCLTNIDDHNVSAPLSNFNRNSAKRKIVKPIKKKKSGQPQKEEESSLKRCRPFNISYTILPRPEEQGASDMKQEDNIQDNLDRESSSSVSELLQKDSELIKELSDPSRAKHYYETSCEGNDEEDKEPKTRDLFSLADCNLILLVGEEFIDDDYDSYVKGLDGEKAHMQVLKNTELYEITRSLVRLYLANTDKLSVVKAMKNGRKLGRRSFNKSKKSLDEALNDDMWREIEKVVCTAILELRSEFRKEISEKCENKLTKLVAELKNVSIEAHEDIEDVCERTKRNLIAQLENIAFKF